MEKTNKRVQRPARAKESNVQLLVKELKKKIRNGTSRDKLQKYIQSENNIVGHAYTRQIANGILKKAYDDLANHEEAIKGKIRPIQLSRSEEVLEQAMSCNDRANALKAIDIINRLYSLYVEKQDIAVTGDVIHFSFGAPVEEKQEEKTE